MLLTHWPAGSALGASWTFPAHGYSHKPGNVTFYFVFEVQLTYIKMHNLSLSFDKRVHPCNQHPNRGFFSLAPGGSLQTLLGRPNLPTDHSCSDVFHRRTVLRSTVLGAVVPGGAEFPSPALCPLPGFSLHLLSFIQLARLFGLKAVSSA